MVKVFIVDDEIDLQLFFKKILTLSGFEIAGVASNGKEAVDMFKSFSEKPDIILMDYRMPIMNGIEATKKILQLDNSSKIIFITADATIKEIAISIGARSVKVKPFTIKKLLKNIKKVLNSC